MFLFSTLSQLGKLGKAEIDGPQVYRNEVGWSIFPLLHPQILFPYKDVLSGIPHPGNAAICNVESIILQLIQK